MYLRSCVIVGLALVLPVPFSFASPVHEANLQKRNVPAFCDKVKDVVDSLKINRAASFCSSYLQISTVTSTVLETIASSSTTFITVIGTSTETVSAVSAVSTTSTSYVFLPGNPPVSPADTRRSLDVNSQVNKEKRAPAPDPNPVYLSSLPTPIISQACSCLDIPTPATTVTSYSTTIVTTSEASTAFTTTTITETLPASPPAATKTVYPCATPASSATSLPSPAPAYALSNYLQNTNMDPSAPPPLGLANGTSNDIYPLSTPQGASAVGCCNACFFELEYCVQAFWYFYQGCVVMAASDFSGSAREGSESTIGQQSCPRGNLPGLVYGPDNGGPFRSTGNIAGPCGEAYTNL